MGLQRVGQQDWATNPHKQRYNQVNMKSNWVLTRGWEQFSKTFERSTVLSTRSQWTSSLQNWENTFLFLSHPSLWCFVTCSGKPTQPISVPAMQRSRKRYIWYFYRKEASFQSLTVAFSCVLSLCLCLNQSWHPDVLETNRLSLHLSHKENLLRGYSCPFPTQKQTNIPHSI